MTSPRIIHGANLIVPQYERDMNTITLHPGSMRDGGQLEAGEQLSITEALWQAGCCLVPVLIMACALVGVLAMGWAR